MCRREARSAQELYAGQRDEHPIYGALRARIWRRTSATLSVHGADYDGRTAGRDGNQLPRQGRQLGHRGHRAAAVHAVPGHGVRGQRKGLQPGPRASVRRDGSQPQGSTCRRFVIQLNAC